MTLEEAKKLEPGTRLEDFGGSCEILKRISDGYIIFGYEDAHYCYYTGFLSFEDIVEFKYEISDNDWDDWTFDGDRIVHTDSSGYCKPIDRED